MKNFFRKIVPFIPVVILIILYLLGNGFRVGKNFLNGWNLMAFGGMIFSSLIFYILFKDTKNVLWYFIKHFILSIIFMNIFAGVFLIVMILISGDF